MIEVSVSRLIVAPRDRVWSLYTDWAGWTDWARLGRVRLAETGRDDPNGVGAVRAIDNFGFEVHEEIVAFDAPDLVRYTVIGDNLPMRDHLGQVTFLERGAATRVTWSCRLQPSIPGTGPAMRRVVQGVFWSVLRQLDARLSSKSRR
jgi:uncharacterized protein YndB with AHSA1/START domain